ncbi:MAG TPA: phytase, partial [Myxococcaceae bacterium]|nr:phytase [Myxococcaceae bacterium]
MPERDVNPASGKSESSYRYAAPVLRAEHKEGSLTRLIEQQAAKIPSDVFLFFSLCAMTASLGLELARERRWSRFVGMWASPLLSMGIYTKLVKLLGAQEASGAACPEDAGRPEGSAGRSTSRERRGLRERAAVHTTWWHTVQEASVRSRTFLALAVLVASLSAAAQPFEVRPVLETQPVIGGGSVVEGAALWVHPTDPSRSLLLVADSQVGLLTYQLEGLREEWLSGGGVLDVDVQPGFPVGGIAQQLVMVANQPLQGLVAYIVDPTTLRLRAAGLEVINVPGFVPTRVALYSSPITGAFYAFAGSATGVVRQFELTPQLDGGAVATPVRTFDVGGAVSGLAVDDALGWLYVTEQNNAIWRYGAEPAASDDRTLVEGVFSGGLAAPLGGLSLYTASNGQGYLLAA